MFIILGFLLGCAAGKRTLPEPSAADPAVVAKLHAYQAMRGVYPENDCDWLLFASLIDVAQGVEAVVELARDAEGRWYRTKAQDCYPDRSGSAISRDMLVGLFIWIYVNKRLDLAEDLFEYGLKHVFVMGEGPLSRTYMTENLQYTLALIIKVLGGKDHQVWKLEPVWAEDVEGFGAHLVVLHASLRAIMGYGSDAAKKALEAHATRQPNNPTYQAALGLYTGDQTACSTLLKDERLCPSDHLPTSADRCSDWFTQRDEGDSWLPCAEEGETHSGGDCLFALALCTGALSDR